MLAFFMIFSEKILFSVPTTKFSKICNMLYNENMIVIVVIIIPPSSSRTERMKGKFKKEKTRKEEQKAR